MTLTIGSDIIFGSGVGVLSAMAGATPVATTLNDGRIALAWAELSYPGDFPYLDYNIYTRILNADGTPATEAQLVTAGPANTHTEPQITALADGGYAVSWITTVQGTVENSDRAVYIYDAYARTFSASGSPDAPPVLISQDLAGYDPTVYNSILQSEIQDTSILGLSGGGALVIYSYRGEETWARSISNDGRTISDPVQVFDDNTFSTGATQLSNGDIVLADYEGQLGGVTLRISAPDLTGAPAGVPGATEPVTFRHSAPVGYEYPPVLAALPEGGFLLAYLYDPSLAADNDEVLRVDRFDAAGGVTGSTDIPVPDNSVNGLPSMAVLSDGRVMLAWTTNTASSNTDVMGVVMNADGSVDGSPQMLNVNTAGLQILGGLTLLGDGGAFLALTDASGVMIGGRADYMHGQFVTLPAAPPPVPVNRTGTDGDDHMIGTPGNDRLAGLDGDDRIEGRDGADTLNGGAGDDFIYGGATSADLRDVIYGGDGRDRIDGGHGNDEAHGGAGDDTVIGDFGADTLIGNAGNDSLSGGAMSDALFGNAGDDTLNGGFGHDRLNGGAGADRFFHTGVAGHGSDWIQDYSAAEGDLLVSGIAGATRAQFQVNIANTPGAGAAGVQEAFVIYIPTRQILWALVDGAGQESLNLQIGGQVYDLLA